MTRKRIGQDEAVIRHTSEADIPSVLRLYALARQTMRKTGNPLQWPEGGGYPGEADLAEDMRRGVSYVIEHRGSIVGTFALVPGEEPNYARITDGNWLDAQCGILKKDGGAAGQTLPYCTIHRLAGDPAYSGIAAVCFDWCKLGCSSLRSDTHRDNRIMQRAFDSAGFVRCGIIYLENGSERTAYQWISPSVVERKTGLAPLLCDAPELLVLGSLPGDRSLELRQYYGHPQNRFWKVVAGVHGLPCPVSYDEKKRLLADCRIILWDVYRAASRPGSMDSDIREAEFNDLAGLLERFPEIRSVALNGAAAASGFRKYLSESGGAEVSEVVSAGDGVKCCSAVLAGRTRRILLLPSTSPANARWTLDKLTAAWKALLPQV